VFDVSNSERVSFSFALFRFPLTSLKKRLDSPPSLFLMFFKVVKFSFEELIRFECVNPKKAVDGKKIPYIVVTSTLKHNM